MYAFLSAADYFAKSSFSKIYLMNTIRVSNSLDLDPNCLNVTVDYTSKQRAICEGIYRSVKHYS